MNDAAQKLGRLRWKGKTKAERSDFARTGVNARWAKHRAGLGWKANHKTKVQKTNEDIKKAIRSGGLVVLLIAAALAVPTIGSEYKTAYAEAAPQYVEHQVRATFYTASPNETDDSPCITADNTNICNNSEPIIAANWLPFDTKVEWQGKFYRVADRMNRRYPYPNIDILVKTKAEAFTRGFVTTTIRVYN